jgi:WhiB family transcriptional regulator, redox-sensing transcriptional regulator
VNVELLEALIAGVDVPTLEELISRPAWMDSGACRRMTARTFFLERGDSSAAARAVCRGCSVVGECLAYALEDETLVGVWGGTSERERRAMRQSVA